MTKIEETDNKILLSYYYKRVLDVFNSDFINKDFIDRAIKLRDAIENDIGIVHTEEYYEIMKNI